MPLDQITELVRAATGNLERREVQRARSEEAGKVVRGLVRAHTSKLKRVRRNAGILASVSAALVTLGQISSTGDFFRRLLFSITGSTSIDEFTISAVSAGGLIVFGAFSWLAHERVGAVAEAIEDASATFDDRSAIVDVVYEIEDASEEDRPWTRSMLAGAVATWSEDENSTRLSQLLGFRIVLRLVRRLGPLQWLRDLWIAGRAVRSLRSLAYVIGPDDFTRLLLEKGREHRVISEEEVVDEGRLTLLYDLTLKDDVQ